MQCKDVPTKPILERILEVGVAGFDKENISGKSVFLGFPNGAPSNLVLAKMKNLIKRGLVDGCACGCCGHFTLTDAGRDSLRLPYQQ